MRIVIFGTGMLYKKFKKKINSKDEIIAFLDNDEEKWGKELDGVTIYRPQDINCLSYDEIVLVSKYAKQMKQQLIELGCCEKRIIHCDEYYGKNNFEESIYYAANLPSLMDKKRCAIICNSLGYHGGAVTALYCALALQECNILVDIVAEDANPCMIAEMNRKGISVVICPNISMAKWHSINWLKEYDYVIVNTMPMILCALEIAKYRSVVMWLHDSDNIYEYMVYWRDNIIQGVKSKNLKICAVSNVAKNNFCKWITDCHIEILPCGIPDEEYAFNCNSKLIFATIGSIHPIKGQDVLLQSIKKLPSHILEQAEFWIIGKETDSEFFQNVVKVEKEISCVKIMGEIEKEKLNALYSKMDVVVIPSRKETMSLVAIEAMLHGKFCIVSDAAGIAEYIDNGKDGLIFSSEDANALAQKIQWCIENKESMVQLKVNARATYEKYFSMNTFKKNLLRLLHLNK